MDKTLLKSVENSSKNCYIDGDDDASTLLLMMMVAVAMMVIVMIR